jgi:TPR repeat protein
MLDARSDFDGEPDLERLRKAYNALGQNPKEGLAELEALANAGSKSSMNYLGYAYETGVGGKPDRELAEIWFKRGYEAGSLAALMQLSYLYLMTDRFSLAEEVLRSGVERGYGLAIYVLGRNYVFGPGKYTKRAEGLQLLRRAAGMGNIFAKRDIGYLLMRGERGFFGRIAGLYIYIDGFVRIPLLAFRNNDDPRLSMYGIY